MHTRRACNKVVEGGGDSEQVARMKHQWAGCDGPRGRSSEKASTIQPERGLQSEVGHEGTGRVLYASCMPVVDLINGHAACVPRLERLVAGIRVV